MAYEAVSTSAENVERGDVETSLNTFSVRVEYSSVINPALESPKLYDLYPPVPQYAGGVEDMPFEFDAVAAEAEVEAAADIVPADCVMADADEDIEDV